MEHKFSSGKTIKAPKKHKGKVTHIRIRKAKNGVVVHHEREHPGMSAGRPMNHAEMSPDPAVFNDRAAAMSHVGGLMDEMGGDEPVSGGPAQ